MRESRDPGLRRGSPKGSPPSRRQAAPARAARMIARGLLRAWKRSPEPPGSLSPAAATWDGRRRSGKATPTSPQDGDSPPAERREADRSSHGTGGPTTEQLDLLPRGPGPWTRERPVRLPAPAARKSVPAAAWETGGPTIAMRSWPGSTRELRAPRAHWSSLEGMSPPLHLLRCPLPGAQALRRAPARRRPVARRPKAEGQAAGSAQAVARRRVVEDCASRTPQARRRFGRE